MKDRSASARQAVAPHTTARCGGCTRRSSTARCSRPSPSCPSDEVRLSPDAASSGWRRSGTTTRWPPCGTSRRSPAGCRGPRASSARCCRRCWTGSPTRPTPTRGCSASAGSPRRWAPRPVPQDPARRGPGRPAARLRARVQPLRHRPAQRAPERRRLLGDDDGLVPRPRVAGEGDGRRRAPARRPRGPAITAGRATRRRELFRIAVRGPARRGSTWPRSATRSPT